MIAGGAEPRDPDPGAGPAGRARRARARGDAGVVRHRHGPLRLAQRRAGREHAHRGGGRAVRPAGRRAAGEAGPVHARRRGTAVVKREKIIIRSLRQPTLLCCSVFFLVHSSRN